MKRILSALFALAVSLAVGASAFVEAPTPDYLSLLVMAASEGDREAGLAAAEGWNRLLDESGSPEPRLDYDELDLLARLIEASAGEVWLRGDFRQCVGEVVMNRVRSPEFPNTVEEVIYRSGEYRRLMERSEESPLPSRECVRAALRVLRGERLLAPQVVYQSDHVRGTVHARFCDRVLGFTYFCESEHPELYAPRAIRKSTEKKIGDQKARAF